MKIDCVVFSVSVDIAAQQNHREACFALTAWYLVGSPGVLPQSDTEAFLWAKRAAEQGLAKAEYAVGYFTEVGIGTIRDEREAISWFRKSAEHGDKRAITRLRTLTNGKEGMNMDISTMNSPPTSPNAKGKKDSVNGGGQQKRKSRRATMLGAVVPSQNGAGGSSSSNGKAGGGKADGDCIIC